MTANKIRAKKSRRIRWARSVASVEYLVGKRESKKLLGRTEIGRRIILKWVLRLDTVG